MADFAALAVVAESVAALLSEARNEAEFPRANYETIGSATITGRNTPDPAQLPATGVTVFPYRVTYNAQRRPGTPRVVGEQRFRPSLLLDLHFLVSAWAPSASQQMRLLGWAARTIEDTPILTPQLLNRVGHHTVFGAAESVEIAPEPLSAQDLVAIWEVNKALQQPSLGYVARMIAIDSAVQLPDATLVRSRELKHGGLLDERS